MFIIIITFQVLLNTVQVYDSLALTGEFPQENKNEDTMPILEGLVVDWPPSSVSGTGLSTDFQVNTIPTLLFL